MRKTILLLMFGIAQTLLSQTPEFVILTTSGEWHQYNSANVNDDIVTATITNTDDIWTLDITANVEIEKVFFPYQSQRKPLDSNISDDIVYYPYISGATEKATNINEDWTWWGALYPGQFFAPWIVVGDLDNGRIVAATNWPAKRVTPQYAAERIILEYDELNLQVNDTEQFSALIKDIVVDPTQDEAPWQLALDNYKGWLNTVLPPISYSQELQNVDGYFYVGLQDWPAFDLPEINSVWIQWQEKLPWIQFWGQMSNYAGPPGLAVPPLLPGEETDCCLLKHEMHTRYLPTLVNYMENSLAGSGYYGGYYSAPFKDLTTGETLLLDTQEGRDWLWDWVNRNEAEYKANTFYLDIIGREYWGDPMAVIDFLNTLIETRPMTFTEGLVDIYPTAGLISGALIGGSIFMGGEGLTPENTVATTFPRLQRYLLNDRITFLGPSNGDILFMGPDADYWLERQTFILGAKFEVSHPNDNWNPATPNPALTLGIDERNNVNWWQRNPIYQDTKGIGNIPSGIEVRQFVDNAGCILFAIDNWSEIAGEAFDFDGQSFSIPSNKLSIIDVCTLSMQEHPDISPTFEIYPNPSSTSITIQSNIPLNNASISIYSISGQVLVKTENAIGNQTIISTKELNEGFYLVSVIFENDQSEVRKLIIE
ncbi:MAG: T9SS type A sorting domain-containing protein [Bacteroidota bacterium]